MRPFRHWCSGSLLLLLPTLVLAADDPIVIQLQQRLDALQQNSELNGYALSERQEAQLAVDALRVARRRDQEAAEYLAKRRIDIAELSARNEAAEHELQALITTQNQLQRDVTRQEEEKVRRQADHQRMLALIREEEEERARQEQAEAEAQEAAQRQEQTRRNEAQLTATRRKEAALAREEAELTINKTLPSSTFNGSDEIFVLNERFFAENGTRLIASSNDKMEAMATYLTIRRNAKVKIEATATSTAVAQGRVNTLRDALTRSGVAANRIRIYPRTGTTQASRAAVITISP